MATLEKGFKAWAERAAASLRKDMGLPLWGTLDCRRLANHLGVMLFSPRQIVGLPLEILKQLSKIDPWGWSASTLEVQGSTFVIYNTRKSLGRQASDIVHELAHLILGHHPAIVVFSEDGQLAIRSFDEKQEDEANWLAWTLLLPRDALIAARRSGMLAAQIATEYGVTETLVNFRLRMTGVNVQLKRRRA